MTQEPTPAADAEPPVSPTPRNDTPDVAPTAVETAPAAVASSPRAKKSGLPPWLPFFLVSALPALIVGVLVFVLAGDGGGGGGGSSGNAAAVIDGFIRLGPTSDGDVTSYSGQAPPEFPTDFPLYKGMKPLASFHIPSEDEGTSYFVVYTASGSTDDVYKYYLAEMDKGSWQIEVARSSDEFTGVRFSRTDNPDVEGDITINRSELGRDTIIYVSYQDIGAKGSANSKQFALPASRPLPEGFPTDVPIFKGKAGDSVVLDTYFERGQGGRSFIITFLTKDSQEDVISFYRGEFEKKGWTVTQGEPSQTRRFAVSIDFDDGSKQSISGTVRADEFADDDAYTEVSLLLQVTGRTRGN